MLRFQEPALSAADFTAFVSKNFTIPSLADAGGVTVPDDFFFASIALTAS